MRESRASIDSDPVVGRAVAGARRAPRRRGLVLGAATSAVALLAAACGTSATTAESHSSSSGLYGALPPKSSPSRTASKQVITIGQIKGDTPLYAMPIVPAADYTAFGVNQFINLYNQPMYWAPDGATEEVDSSLSFADPPVFSNGDRTVTITIKRGWKWSNGDPLTAANVIEYIDIAKAAVAKAPDNLGDFSPGLFPDNIASATAPSTDTLVLHLTTKYNPLYFYDDQLNEVYALPTQWMVDRAGGKTLDYANPADAKLIYDYLNTQASDLSTMGSNPLWKIDDGPMVLNSFNATTGGWTMTPNPDFSGPQKADFKELEEVTYTSTQAEFDALETGGLDISSQIDPTEIPELSSLKAKGYSYFGLPDFGFQGAFLNFKDTTGDFDHIIAQLYVRQALQHLMNEPGDITGIFKKAAEPDYTTIVAVPTSPYAPADASTAMYAYSPKDASKLLTSHGWKKVGGTLTCERPGTGSADCGKGIPAGTKLAFSWQYANTPASTGELAVAFASIAKSIGIKVTIQEKTFNDLVTEDNDPSAPSQEHDWAISDFGGFTSDLYPTTITLFNTGGDENLGEYSSSEANTLIHNSVYGGNKAAVQAEASYLGKDLPVIYTADPDYVYAVKDTVGGTNSSWLSLTQFYWVPEDWYPTSKS